MATYEYNSVVLTGQKSPARLSALFVTASFFDVMKFLRSRAARSAR